MDGTICTSQDLERVKSSSLHCITRGETVGLTVLPCHGPKLDMLTYQQLLVVTGVISAFAVLLVYLLIIVRSHVKPGLLL